MKLKSVFIFVLTMLVSNTAISQDSKILAQSQYYRAEEAYNEGNYTDALKYLEKAEGYAGTNHLIQYLKVKSFYMNAEYIPAQQAMAIFFEVIDSDLQSTSQYKEMVMLVADLETLIERAEQYKREGEERCNTSIICDRFDDYIVGEYIVNQSNGLWRTSIGNPGTKRDAFISDQQASSLPNSILIEGSSSLLLKLGNLKSKSYEIGWKLFIQSGFGAVINIMHEKDPENSYNNEFGLALRFTGNGKGSTFNGGENKPFNYIENKWFDVQCKVDLDNDIAVLKIDGVIVREWQYSLQSYADLGIKQLAAIVFYANMYELEVKYFLDDIYLKEAEPLNNRLSRFKRGTIMRITDPRDGNKYNALTIGNQTWMVENLNYETSGSYAYKNNTSYRNGFGLYYTWDAAMKACPQGWHLPSDKEWDTLVNSVGVSKAGTALKSTNGWNDDGNGTNSSGFNALSGGFRNSAGTFYRFGELGFFWSSTEKRKKNAWYRDIRHDRSDVSRFETSKDRAFSCRCLKD